MRFEVGERVRVITHPARPPALVLARWDGATLADPHQQPAYAVSGFVTRQRESSLAAEGFQTIALETLAGWRVSGQGVFHRVAPDTIESDGGPGLLWYTLEEFEDFVLLVDWRVSARADNSGIFVRCPPLDGDWEPAATDGYEIQIDERGIDHASGREDSPQHRTGAVYGLAPARAAASRPPGQWNTFAIEVQDGAISVVLNGVPVCAVRDGGRRRRGHLGLQAHHAGSRVQFRNLQIKRL